MSAGGRDDCIEGPRTKFPAVIDHLALGDAEPAVFTELRPHLAACASCRGRYDRAVIAERRLAGGPRRTAEPSARELARIEAAVFASLEPEERSLAARVRRWLTPLVAATVAVAGAALFVVARPPTDQGELRARGAETNVRPVSVRAFCVDGASVVPLGEAAPSCALSAAMKLAVGNRGAYTHVFVVGRQDDHTPRWYLPRPPGTESVSAPERDAGEVPMGAAVRLAVNHHAGPLRVHALFSEAPIEARELEAAFAALAERGTSAVDAVELPITRRDVVQRSVLIEVAP